MSKKPQVPTNQLTIPYGNESGFIADLAQETRLRGAISQAIHQSRLSFAQVAEQISTRLGEKISEDMLYAITADSHKQHRPPAMWVMAVCMVTGNFLPMQVLCETCGGGRYLTKKEARLFELGQATLHRKEAEDRAEALATLAQQEK
jgi:hypothetical protein